MRQEIRAKHLFLPPGPEKCLEVCLLLEGNPENRCRVGKL